MGEAVFGLALRAFPPGFRAAYGAELREAFRSELARSGTAAARTVLAARSIADVARQGLRERIRAGLVLPGHGARMTDQGRGKMFDGLTTDFRLALRGLRRAPGFTIAAVVVLALGIGANATVYSALRETVLAPAPYPDADRLVLADLTMQRIPEEPFQPLIWSFPKYRMFLDAEDRPVDPAIGYASRSATLTGLGAPEMVTLEIVSPGYFALVGRSPTLGRGFVPEELDATGDPLVAVLSADFWRARFGARPDVLTEEITLNGRRLRVVGVAPDGFEGLTGGADLWVPMGASAELYAPFMLEQEGTHWFHILGRLTEGTSFEAAQARMVAIGDAIAEAFPSPNSTRRYSGGARSLAEVRENEDARAAVVFLSLAAGLVLLVACANLSGLMLARARRRAKDGAVRAALGASRWRLVRASLVESLAIAGAGGAAGVGLALLGTRGMAAAWPSRFSSGTGGDLTVMSPEALGVDPAVLSFALGATLATALLFGLAPALRAARGDVATRIREESGATRRARRILGLDGRAALVGGQIALALVLIIGTGLVGGSTLRLLDVEEGFRPERLLTFTYSIPRTNSRASEPLALHDAFLAAVRRIDGVESATYGCAPLRGHCIITRVDAVQDGEDFEQGEGPAVGVFMVDDEHFEALGIPVVRGRTFDSRDGTDRQPTVVLNEFAARELFGDDEPIGRFIELGLSADDRDRMAEVVGVVGDVLYSRPESGFMGEAYFSYREFPETFGNVTVRARSDPLALEPALRAAMQQIDPSIALYRIETMDRLIARSVGDRRSTLALLALFAAVAVMLAATGTWGVVAYAVADRRKELGLRLALGAESSGVVRSVLGQSFRAAILGVGAGLGLGLLSSRLVEALLWQTEPNDPVVYAAAASLLMVLVLGASWIPARNAARVDPVEALKAE